MQISEEGDNFFRYLDLPTIPKKYLLYTIEEIESQENIFQHATYSYYKQYKVFDKELLNLLEDVFLTKLLITYQVIRNGIAIHKDIGRTEATNFVIHPGGDNVITEVYSGNLSKKYVSECIQPYKWHWLNVSMPHTVKNITDTRLSISVERI